MIKQKLIKLTVGEARMSDIVSPTEYSAALIPKDDHRTYLTVGGHEMDPGTPEETHYVVLGLTDQADTDEAGRYLELSSYLLPDEARRLAALLVAQADAAAAAQPKKP